jgi:hypothetical protein
VVNLHYMLSKTVVKARPSVLWCYKKELYLSSHKKKRMKQIKKMAQVCVWGGGGRRQPTRARVHGALPRILYCLRVSTPAVATASSAWQPPAHLAASP